MELSEITLEYALKHQLDIFGIEVSRKKIWTKVDRERGIIYIIK